MLKKYIEGLEIWLHSNNPNSNWNDVLIVDEADLYKEGKIIKNFSEVLSSLNDYEHNFIQLIHEGYSWLNLSAVGIFKGNLVVCVEKPAHPSGLKKEQLSVNYSGNTKTL